MSAEPLQGKTVRSAMELGLFSCPADTGLRSLARMMAERQIHSVVVRGLRDAPHAYGIVSDLDLLAGFDDPGHASRATSSPRRSSPCDPTTRSRRQRT